MVGKFFEKWLVTAVRTGSRYVDRYHLEASHDPMNIPITRQNPKKNASAVM